jgi:hypothetical protein
VIAACAGHFERLSSGDGPRSRQEQEMSLTIAQAYGWNLARTMMASVVIFRISESLFGVAEAREFDGDPETVVREYDPHELR